MSNFDFVVIGILLGIFLTGTVFMLLDYLSNRKSKECPYSVELVEVEEYGTVYFVLHGFSMENHPPILRVGKITAIKLSRLIMNLRLREAKDFTESCGVMTHVIGSTSYYLPLVSAWNNELQRKFDNGEEVKYTW